MNINPFQILTESRATGAAGLAERGADKAKLKEACREFEAIFLKQMLDSMRKTIDRSELSDGGMVQDVFEDFLYEEYAQRMSKSGSFGLEELMYGQLERQLAQTV